MMTWFRERVTREMLAEVNDYIIGRKKKDEKEVPPSAGGTGDNEGKQHDGTLVLGATCCPHNIRFPTDASLLNEGREKLEGMVDSAYQARATEGNKPRIYRNLARRDWLRFARDRKPTHKKVRKAICQQLGYIRRDLEHLEGIQGRHPDVTTAKQLERLTVVRAMYEQHKEVFEKRTRRVEDRIVSLHQPWVRPIVRGKKGAPVEFGAKVV